MRGRKREERAMGQVGMLQNGVHLRENGLGGV